MVAPDNFNKQPDVHKPTETVMAHQVQLVQEIEEPNLSKKVDTEQPVEKPAEPPKTESQSTPTQVTPKNKGCEEYRSEISKYDWPVAIMLAIAKAESGCRSNARGDGHLTYTQNSRTYGYSLGLFQVRILPGREHCDTNEVQVNVRCAYDIYKGQGLKAWSVYSNGAYKKHL